MISYRTNKMCHNCLEEIKEGNFYATCLFNVNSFHLSTLYKNYLITIY